MRPTALVLLALSILPVQARASSAPAPGEMAFRRLDAPNLCQRCDVVEASGEIGSDTAARFTAFAEREKLGGRPLTIVLYSGGGRVRAGWALGRKLRALKASVIVGRVVERQDGALELRAGLCVSMCNSVLSAGVERRIATGTLFGVHQFSPAEDKFKNLDNAITVRELRSQLQMVSEWLAYAREMRIDQRLVEAQLSVPFEKVDFIPHDKLAAWRVITAPSATIPKLLRNPRPNLEAVASQPAANPETRRPAPAPAARPANREWAPVRFVGEWRETMMESDADFMRVWVSCANNGRVGVQFVFLGAPEARQKALAQQIVAGGGFELVDRPVDLFQTSFGFGNAFWVRAFLRADQVARLAASRGQLKFATMSPKEPAAKLETVQMQSTGFSTVENMLAACASKQPLEIAAKPQSN